MELLVLLVSVQVKFLWTLCAVWHSRLTYMCSHVDRLDSLTTNYDDLQIKDQNCLQRINMSIKGYGRKLLYATEMCEIWDC